MTTHKRFKGSLGEYTVIETEDTSPTLYSEAFDENCHSLSGSILETLYNYVEGCEIAKFSQSPSPIVVLEVGFALGVGLLETLKVTRASQTPLVFISTEIDKLLVEWTLNLNSFRDMSFQYKQSGELAYYECREGKDRFIILIGDARKTIPLARDKHIVPPVNAIYQDPFSPRKNAELWTTEWFKLLKGLCDNSVIMSTYSASTRVRKSMLAAGWHIENRKGFGPKRSATRAFLNRPSDRDLLENLNRSQALPLSDHEIEDYLAAGQKKRNN